MSLPAGRILLLGDDNGIIEGPLRHLGAKIVRADCCGGWADIICDEDRLPFADGVFDAVFACGSLDSVNDLPGALLLARRLLKPDGIFLGSFLGAGTGDGLREACVRAAGTDRVVARAHPMIDVRAAGDLLARAGFFEPVADTEEVKVRYRSLMPALADRRANATGNCLSDRAYLSRHQFVSICERVAGSREGGAGIEDTLAIMFLTGHAGPHSLGLKETSDVGQ